MRSHSFTAALLVTCSLFFMSHTGTNSPVQSPEAVIDFSVHRLSGTRVCITWHTNGGPEAIRFEVMRRFGRTTSFAPVGLVQPKLQTSMDSIVDYSFIDEENNYQDTSFYRLKKTAPDGVIFYSLSKAVAGIEKDLR